MIPGSRAFVCKRPALAGLWLLLILAALPATAAEPVLHEVSFPERHNQYMRLRSGFPAPGDSLEVAMPVWTPGSYLVRDFAAHLENLVATGPEGQPLPTRKVSKNRWRIDTRGAQRVMVSYDVWAGELNVSSSWVEAGMALINGAGVFLFSDESRRLPQQVVLRLPDDWPDAHSGLEPGGTPGTFLAVDYDELVDSPIIAGKLQLFEFRVAGHPFALVLSGENPLWDGEASARDLARIVKAQLDFWGSNPFDRRYLFINVFKGPWGGLEHDHSTVMMSSPWQMRDRGEYRKWLGLASHEFFHAWNVRRLRPQALAEYDYDRETYTRELWLAEGLTSYYDDLTLFRAGLIDVPEYFALLAREIRNYETMPGKAVRSAELASFDTWIKQYKPNENSVNSTVSYYRKGALIGFVTDWAIRRETRNNDSLDTVLREMYRRYGPESGSRGYPPGAFESLVEETAGAEARALVEDMLRSTNDPPVDEALDWYGLDLDREWDRNNAERKGEPPPAGFGVSWDAAGPQLLIDEVVRGTAAADAGLLPGDELLAVDGFRITPENYQVKLRRLRPDEQVVLTLSRHGRLMELPLTVQHEIPDRFHISARAGLNKREKERMEAWLGRELRFNR